MIRLATPRHLWLAPRTVIGQMRVVAHNEWDLHGTRIKDGGEQQKSWTRDVNDVRFEILNDFGALHFGQINGQGDVIVEGKGESLRVLDWVSHVVSGEVLGGSLAVHGENIDVVSGLFEKLEHFLEAIGVSRDMRKGSGFDHQADFAWGIALKIGRTQSRGRSGRRLDRESDAQVKADQCQSGGCEQGSHRMWK